MKRETQHDRLAQLGEALLREFEAAQIPPVPAEFDRKCRAAVSRKNRAGRVFLWAARAAVLVFALIGMASVAVLSIGPLRTPVMRYAAERLEPETDPEEEAAEYTQISYAKADNTTLSVYYDGASGYRILVSNEYGQRLYSFLSPDIDQESIRRLGAQLAATENWTFGY